MNRVTYWNDEYGCWSYHCSSGDAAKILAAYEDTGLDPEEISELLLADELSPEAKYAINEHADSLIKHLDALVHKDDNELKKYRALGSLDHLKELVQAYKDGRLVVLPCKVGDVVYESNKRGFISTYKVISIRISYCSVLIGWELIDGIYSNLNGFEVSALGKTVFLTREEAEAALAEKGEKQWKN